MGWSSPPASGGGSIAPLSVVDANTIQQRNSTNAQVSYTYGTFTDASNYSRVKVTHAGGTAGATISAEALGTGTGGPLTLKTSGLAGASVKTYIFGTDGTFTVGGTAPTATGLFQAVIPATTVGISLQQASGAYSYFDCQDSGNRSVFRLNESAQLGFGTVGSAGVDVYFQRSAAGVIEINSGAQGTFRDLIARNVRTNPTTVASLTAAATAGAGARSFVTDATAPTFGATVAGGGAVATPVYSDGTNWKVG